MVVLGCREIPTSLFYDTYTHDQWCHQRNEVSKFISKTIFPWNHKLSSICYSSIVSAPDGEFNNLLHTPTQLQLHTCIRPYRPLALEARTHDATFLATLHATRVFWGVTRCNVTCNGCRSRTRSYFCNCCMQHCKKSCSVCPSLNTIQ